jgi:DNA-binding transcriptional MerR regulator
MVGWTARALARQTGVPAATVASWVTSGLVTPEQYGRGRGGHIIGVSGLLELLAVVELRQAGVPMQAIRRAVENLRQLSGHERPLARLTLIVSGKDIVWKDALELSGVTISALHKPGQRLMVFPVGEIHTEMLLQLQTNESHQLTPLHYKAKEELSRVS